MVVLLSICTDLDHREGNYVILRMLGRANTPSVLAKQIADAEKLNILYHPRVQFGRSIGLDRNVSL